MAVFLGFSAEIQGINYPAAAIFKLDAGAAVCWNGDHPTNGYLAVFDLLQQKRHWVSGSFGVHGSRHRNGVRHQALEPAGHRKIYISPYMDTAAKDLASDSHIRTVHVPLLQGFEWWPIKTPLWDAIATTSRHVLRREDFGERVDGVILQGFMCRHACVDDLLARWRKSSYKWWVERDREFDLVVLAEVVRVPMPLPAERRCAGQ